MAGNFDFAFNSEQWQEIITTLREAHQAMNEICDAMKKVVQETLLKCGIEGDTANVLNERYESDILSSIREFSAKLEEFIEKNQTNYDRAQELTERTTNIANG